MLECAQDDVESMPLTFGSIIFLGESESTEQYIYSDGIIDKSMQIRNFMLPHNQKNFKKCLFMVFPPFINTYKKETMELRV